MILSAYAEQSPGGIQAYEVMLKQILPNDLVALLEDIFDPLRGVVHGIWVREEDFLIFEFVPV